jgi:hypothetical protein
VEGRYQLERRDNGRGIVPGEGRICAQVSKP